VCCKKRGAIPARRKGGAVHYLVFDAALCLGQPPLRASARVIGSMSPRASSMQRRFSAAASATARDPPPQQSVSSGPPQIAGESYHVARFHTARVKLRRTITSAVSRLFNPRRSPLPCANLSEGFDPQQKLAMIAIFPLGRGSGFKVSVCVRSIPWPRVPPGRVISSCPWFRVRSRLSGRVDLGASFV
jgi:hypothetical protein